MVKNSVLCRNARTQLGGSIFRSRWFLMLFALTLASIFTTIPVVLIETSDFAKEAGLFTKEFRWILFIVGVLLMIMFTGPFSFGVARVTVDCVEGDYWGIGNVFHGFGKKYFSAILLDFLLNFWLVLWSLLFLLPGLVKTYAYSMAFYVRQDPAYAHLEASDCITESRRMMDGYKWQLFCLDLRFVGWYLLGALCLGVGILFVFPYHMVARANFYDALKAAHMRAFPAAPIDMRRYR